MRPTADLRRQSVHSERAPVHRAPPISLVPAASPLRIAAFARKGEAGALVGIAGIEQSGLRHEIAVGLDLSAGIEIEVARLADSVGRVVEAGEGAARVAVADAGSGRQGWLVGGGGPLISPAIAAEEPISRFAATSNGPSL